MKRRFFKRARSSGRSFFRARRHGSSGLSPMNILLAGAVYGVARPYVANVLPDLFKFGPVDSDNAILGAAGGFGMWKGKGFLKALGTVALATETGIVSGRLATGTTSTNSSGLTVYG